MNTTESRLKKPLALTLLVAVTASLVMGVSSYTTNKVNKELATDAAVTTSEPIAVASTTVNAVLGAQTANNKGYKVQVTSVSKTDKLQVGITITNTSTDTIQFSPGLQFNLVATASREVKDLLPTAVMAGGPIAPNASVSGVLTFNTFISNEQFELRFYPDVAGTDYVVIPLATN